jgi:predicted transport protein
MSDIKLFRLEANAAVELSGSSVALEKSLQNLIEEQLDTFLGVRFLKSEHSTGKTHGGRIDTLGIDENNSPVIIEYKRSMNENVINQGLFYLDWLLDHRAEFTLMAMGKALIATEDEIDWSSPRLICIAGDFTKYDEHAISQINRSIELVRYRKYGEEFLLFELVNVVRSTADTDPTSSSSEGGKKKPRAKTTKTVSEYLAQAPTELQDLNQAVEDFALAFGDDVSRKVTQVYIAFRRIKNFMCVEVHPHSRKLLLYLKVDPTTIELEPGFSRDVRNIGHFGTGDLEVTITNIADLERAKPLIVASYEAS